MDVSGSGREAILDLLENEFHEEYFEAALSARVERTINMSIKATGQESTLGRTWKVLSEFLYQLYARW